MNEAKFRRVMEGVTTTARKVYESLPLSEPWTTNQVAADLVRRGIAVEFNIMVGCINALIRAGVVTEPKHRHYIRVPIRAKAVQAIVDGAAISTTNLSDEDDIEEIEDMPRTDTGGLQEALRPIALQVQQRQAKATAAASASTESTAMDRLAALAERAKALATDVKALAGDIEQAALDIAETMAATEAQAAQLRQLKALLKGIE